MAASGASLRADVLVVSQVKNTTERSWWRLVGRRHDVQWWTADTPRHPPPLPKHPMGNLKYAASGMPESLQVRPGPQLAPRRPFASFSFSLFFNSVFLFLNAIM